MNRVVQIKLDPHTPPVVAISHAAVPARGRFHIAWRREGSLQTGLIMTPGMNLEAFDYVTGTTAVHDLNRCHPGVRHWLIPAVRTVHGLHLFMRPLHEWN